MSSVQFSMLPAPPALRNVVECVRIARHSSEEALAIHVAPGGLPGMALLHDNGRPVLEHITMRSGRKSYPAPLFLYGVSAERSVMHYKKGSYTSIQVIFKPHALYTLFGVNAAQLSNGWAQPREFGAGDLDERLFAARDEGESFALLTDFLMARLGRTSARDLLIEESLRFIHNNIGTLRVKDLLQHLHISERQFERRFIQAVGISPLLYIRMQRFQEAVRLIKAGQFARLTDIACALNFSDQSHFIRDIKTFSGITPGDLAQKLDDFYHGRAGYFYF